eukprot:TRINITY_DN1655_c0_g1_i1.p1 TRINITY_DN1655_c0_g1~~TRINITY_DN1655_c0_g1_i1.p1  ORF type:complete len:435 (+),score=112.59 TRINITY_DN1655_c0_g1_i1:602-1906(+)
MVLKDVHESNEARGKDEEGLVGMLVTSKFQKLFLDPKFEGFFHGRALRISGVQVMPHEAGRLIFLPTDQIVFVLNSQYSVDKKFLVSHCITKFRDIGPDSHMFGVLVKVVEIGKGLGFKVTEVNGPLHGIVHVDHEHDSFCQMIGIGDSIVLWCPNVSSDGGYFEFFLGGETVLFVIPQSEAEEKMIVSHQARGTQLNVSQVDGITDFRFCRERVFLADIDGEVRNVSLMCFVDDCRDKTDGSVRVLTVRDETAVVSLQIDDPTLKGSSAFPRIGDLLFIEMADVYSAENTINLCGKVQPKDFRISTLSSLRGIPASGSLFLHTALSACLTSSFSVALASIVGVQKLCRSEKEGESFVDTRLEIKLSDVSGSTAECFVLQGSCNGVFSEEEIERADEDDLLDILEQILGKRVKCSLVKIPSLSKLLVTSAVLTE